MTWLKNLGIRSMLAADAPLIYIESDEINE